jgi:hypothetical protein
LIFARYADRAVYFPYLNVLRAVAHSKCSTLKVSGVVAHWTPSPNNTDSQVTQVHIGERSHEWRGLFSGLQVSWANPISSPPPPNPFLQIIDLEHASLHMSCPIVPKDAPLPSLRQLQTSAKDPFYSLTQMMHTGLSHFTGRGLPTIWSFISSNQVSKFSSSHL